MTVALILIALVSVLVRSQLNYRKVVVATSNGAEVNVLQLAENPDAIAFESGMTIDADGAPDAYAPGNKGTDDLSNGGRPGNWWALVTSTNKPDGEPVVRNGFYVSMTSLEDGSRPVDDPARYVNANEIPFFVLPAWVKEKSGVRLGDLGLVVNLKNSKASFAIFADEGPADHMGEGSIALARALEIDPNPRSGGTDAHVLYVVFPGSGAGRPLAGAEINRLAQPLLERLGGSKNLRLSWNLAKLICH